MSKTSKKGKDGSVNMSVSKRGKDGSVNISLLSTGEEGKQFVTELLEALLIIATYDEEKDEETQIVEFVSDCYFTTVTNILNMAFLPMNMEPYCNDMEDSLGSYRQLSPLPRPTLYDH